MNCLKCGREIAADQVFCEACLMDMAKHPVHPGTVIQLPKRHEASSFRKPVKRRIISADEQVKNLKKLVRGLVLGLLVCLILIGLMIYPTFQYLTGTRFQLGQNYSVVTVTTAPAENTEAAD